MGRYTRRHTLLLTFQKKLIAHTYIPTFLASSETMAIFFFLTAGVTQGTILIYSILGSELWASYWQPNAKKKN